MTKPTLHVVMLGQKEHGKTFVAAALASAHQAQS
jgi:predicted kinase